MKVICSAIGWRHQLIFQQPITEETYKEACERGVNHRIMRSYYEFNMYTIGSNVYLCLWLPPWTCLWMPVCCTVANRALAMLGRHTVQEAGSYGTISMSSDHCHDREATMMRNFSIVVTVTRVDHKQRPSISIPPYPTLLFVFPVMCSLSHLIYFPSSASLVFWCLLPKKNPSEAHETPGSLNIIIRGHVRLRGKMSFTPNNDDKAVYWSLASQQWFHTSLCSYTEVTV